MNLSDCVDGTAFDLVGEPCKPVVVLIHGLGVNRQLWRDHIAELSQHFRVLSYDLLGHGESERPEFKPTLQAFAAQLNSLLDQLHIKRCAIAGFSVGGMINRRFAMDYSEYVSALIVLNSPHQRSAAEQEIIDQRVADTVQGGPSATIETSLARWFTEDFRAKRTDIVAEVRSWILSNDPIFYSQCREVLATGVAELIRPQPPLSVPTLVITCENDTGSTPAMSYGIAGDIPESQVLIIPKLQHLGLMEHPAVFCRPIIDFLLENQQENAS